MGMTDFSRVKSRVTEILNLCDAGTFSSSVSTRNKTRNALAIEAACYEAGLKILQTIGEVSNEFREGLISVVNVTHGQLLPAHLGKPAHAEIQGFSGDIWRKGKRKDIQQIEAYRANKDSVYDEIAHDLEGSSLGGFYNVREKKFYYTGYAARVGLAQAARADVLTKIPDFFEATCIKLAVGNCPKAGEGAFTMQMMDYYLKIGLNDLTEFKQGRRMFDEVSGPELPAAAAAVEMSQS